MIQLVLGLAVAGATLSVFQNCGDLRGEHTLTSDDYSLSDTTAVGSVDPAVSAPAPAPAPAALPNPTPAAVVCAVLVDGFAAAGSGSQGNYLGAHPDSTSCSQACKLLNRVGACAYVIDRQSCFFYTNYAVAPVPANALHPVAAGLCQ